MNNETINLPRDKLEAMAFGRMEFAEFSQYMDELQRMLARPESASGKLPPIGRQAVWQAIDEALTGTVEPMLRGDICNILAAILVPATQHQGEPVVWWNGCNESVPAALRYLANHPRPSGGEQRYNAEHLYQLAGEIERMAKTPLYARPAEQPAPISSTSDKYKAELYDEVWQLARDMDFGNVTDALMKLKKQPAPVAVVLPEQWLPIETAPKDGTEIILRKGDRITAGAWIEWSNSAAEFHATTGVYLGDVEYESGADWSSWDGGFRRDDWPTHWQPLPIPPQQ